MTKIGEFKSNFQPHLFRYLPNILLLIFSFSSKRERLSKDFCIFVLEHRLIVLMGHLPVGCFVMAMMASAEARRCDFCG